MQLEMTITQTNNGWILRFVGHDLLDKVIVHQDWGKVIKELEEYFGWWVNDKWKKEK